MISVVLADGRTCQHDAGVCALDVVRDLSTTLASKSVLCQIDGVLSDLSRTLSDGARVEFIDSQHDAALEVIRHDCAHVLAQAVQHLYPDAKPTIGPAIKNGFFYDFAREQPFTPEDLSKIESYMRKLIAQKQPFVRTEWTRQQAIEYYQNRGEPYKIELIGAIPEGETISFYQQGDFLDLCRGPHMRHTGDIGQAFKLTHIAGSYWRGDSKIPCYNAFMVLHFQQGRR